MIARGIVTKLGNKKWKAKITTEKATPKITLVSPICKRMKDAMAMVIEAADKLDIDFLGWEA